MEEVTPDIMPRYEHEMLMDKIEELAAVVAQEIFDPKHPDPPATQLLKVRSRYGLFRALRTSKLRAWRIHGLHRPLWLGEDGLIYFGYPFPESMWFGTSYLMVAEYHRRDANGLKRIVRALS